MPREELGRQTGDAPQPERVNRPGLERGKGEQPPETIFEKVVIARGPPGDPGPRGLVGPPGAAGNDGLVSYRHVQSVAAEVWTVVHNLGYRPGGIYVEDSSHRAVSGRVTHIDANTLTISFFVAGVPAATGGEADIS